jgi:hypothetical protein
MEIKQNNFKIKRCIALMFTASIILMLFTHICAAVDISPNNIEEEIVFDEPKAAKCYGHGTGNDMDDTIYPHSS